MQICQRKVDEFSGAIKVHHGKMQKYTFHNT